MARVIRVVQVGLGPIGGAACRYLLERDDMELAGAVDIDKHKAGRDVGDVLGLGRRLGVTVESSVAAAIGARAADAAIQTTVSRFAGFHDQVASLLQAGLDVVSTSEELSFPWLAHPEAAKSLDALAKAAERTVLGTGVNPGFLMDALPLYLTGICQTVSRVEVVRVIDASKRRGPFQDKIGAGLSAAEFEERVAAGDFGHVGLPESIHMLFDTLGRRLVKIESTIAPVVAEREMRTDHLVVPPGLVCGLEQTARGYHKDGEFVQLTFHAALGAQDEGDTIRILGRPDLEVVLKGTNGDVATAAIAVNAVRRVCEAPPGLLTMRDLPPVTR